MLRAIIICPDHQLTDVLEEQLCEIGYIGIVRKVDRYPTGIELTRFLRAHAPHVIFLSIEALDSAFEVVAGVEASAPGVQIVAMNRTCDPQVLLELMRKGIREFLAPPLSITALSEALTRVHEALEKKPPAIESTDLLFSFLPSKAGVGASTVAVNAAGAASKMPDTNALLIDLDLNSGMVRFMLKLDNAYSVLDAAENAQRMDEQLWPPLVTSIDHLDVLHAGKLRPDLRVEAPQIRHLIEFARRNYKVICVDLSGNLERYSIEVMHESKRIFLVCTPEIPSLHLAREKLNFLRGLDLGDRVHVLLNRAQRRAMISAAQIEELLGVPVQMTFPNDYHGVHKSLTAGKYVDATSELGKQFNQLARTILEKKPTLVRDGKKAFVEYFSLLPARYTIVPDNNKTAVS
jgi:pilus assembly protein CpaE